MKLRRRSKQEVGKCVRVFSFSFVGLSPFSVVVSTSLPVGRHELPVDRSASLFVGPYGILWSGPACSVSCSTASTTFCTDDATAILDIPPLSNSKTVFPTGSSFDNSTYVCIPTYILDDSTGSMSCTSLGTHYDDHPHATTPYDLALSPSSPCYTSFMPSHSAPPHNPSTPTPPPGQPQVVPDCHTV